MKKSTKYIIGGVVGVCVIVAIVVPLAVLLPADDAEDTSVTTTTAGTTTKYTFQFDDLYNSKYSYKSLYPNWYKTDDSDKFIARSSDGSNAVVTRDISDAYNDIDILVPSTVYNEIKWYTYAVSADRKFASFVYNRKPVWRHSYTGNYYIYDIVNKKKVVSDDLAFLEEDDALVQHIEWSPTGHQCAVVYNFTVWTINLDAATATVSQISPTGERNMKYYGIPDWMNEEEMIGAKDVLYWSPNGNNLAYVETTEENVQLIEYTMYNDEQYPETIEIAYPKAGTTIGVSKMFVSDLKGQNSLELVPDLPFSSAEYYFSRFTWLDDITCLITWINRQQNHSAANLCTYGTKWICTRTTANEEQVDGGWIGSFGPFNPVWKGNTKDYFTIYAYEYDNVKKDGRWQIVFVEDGKGQFTRITKTNHDVTGLKYYDSANDWLYFEQAAPLPRNRHIYRTKTDVTDNSNPECMTCALNEGDYKTRCGWISFSLNYDGSSAVINCRGYMYPMTLLIRISADGTWGTPEVIENNDDLQTEVENTYWPVKEYGTFKSDKYEKEFNYEIWKPENFDPSKKYPLLLEVYAGPEFQKITDTWRKGWAQTYMVGNQGAIVVSVDGRGSAFEGYKFMRQIYWKLGQYEPVDQTDFVKHIAEMDFIDETRVGLWGWSYGGYTTSHTLGYDAGNTFKCGIAVAPLADWRYYDAMYAERYMGTPTDNDEGYTKASIITGHDLENFKEVDYTLIHGTADDNVHFQNAAEMEKALVEADVDFDDFFYADQAHSINIGNANKHIYRQLSIRMANCLGLSEVSYPGNGN